MRLLWILSLFILHSAFACEFSWECRDCIRQSCYYYETTHTTFCGGPKDLYSGKLVLKVKKLSNCEYVKVEEASRQDTSHGAIQSTMQPFTTTTHSYLPSLGSSRKSELPVQTEPTLPTSPQAVSTTTRIPSTHPTIPTAPPTDHTTIYMPSIHPTVQPAPQPMDATVYLSSTHPTIPTAPSTDHTTTYKPIIHPTVQPSPQYMGATANLSSTHPTLLSTTVPYIPDVTIVYSSTPPAVLIPPADSVTENTDVKTTTWAPVPSTPKLHDALPTLEMPGKALSDIIVQDDANPAVADGSNVDVANDVMQTPDDHHNFREAPLPQSETDDFEVQQKHFLRKLCRTHVQLEELKQMKRHKAAMGKGTIKKRVKKCLHILKE